VYEVGDHEGCWACETSLRRIVNGSAPSSLVEGKDFDGLGGKSWEELVVSVTVIAIAMDEYW